MSHKKTGLKSRNVSSGHFSSRPKSSKDQPTCTRINIRLLEGSHLLASDVVTGKSDPVCFVWCGGLDTTPDFNVEEGQREENGIMLSTVCRTTVDPRWDEEIVFPVQAAQLPDLLNMKCVIYVRDEDEDEPGVLTYDELGMVEIKFAEIISLGKRMHGSMFSVNAAWYPLQKSPGMRKAEGHIKLSISLIFGVDDATAFLEDMLNPEDQAGATPKPATGDPSSQLNQLTVMLQNKYKTHPRSASKSPSRPRSASSNGGGISDDSSVSSMGSSRRFDTRKGVSRNSKASNVTKMASVSRAPGSGRRRPSVSALSSLGSNVDLDDILGFGDKYKKRDDDGLEINDGLSPINQYPSVVLEEGEEVASWMDEVNTQTMAAALEDNNAPQGTDHPERLPPLGIVEEDVEALGTVEEGKLAVPVEEEGAPDDELLIMEDPLHGNTDEGAPPPQNDIEVRDPESLPPKSNSKPTSRSNSVVYLDAFEKRDQNDGVLPSDSPVTSRRQSARSTSGPPSSRSETAQLSKTAPAKINTPPKAQAHMRPPSATMGSTPNHAVTASPPTSTGSATATARVLRELASQRNFMQQSMEDLANITKTNLKILIKRMDKVEKLADEQTEDNEEFDNEDYDGHRVRSSSSRGRTASKGRPASASAMGKGNRASSRGSSSERSAPRNVRPAGGVRGMRNSMPNKPRKSSPFYDTHEDNNTDDYPLAANNRDRTVSEPFAPVWSNSQPPQGDNNFLVSNSKRLQIEKTRNKFDPQNHREAGDGEAVSHLAATSKSPSSRNANSAWHDSDNQPGGFSSTNNTTNQMNPMGTSGPLSNGQMGNTGVSNQYQQSGQHTSPPTRGGPPNLHDWEGIAARLKNGEVHEIFDYILDRGTHDDLVRLLKVYGPHVEGLSYSIKNRTFDAIATILLQGIHVERCLVWVLALIQNKLVLELSQHTQRAIFDGLRKVSSQEKSRRSLLAGLLCTEMNKALLQGNNNDVGGGYSSSPSHSPVAGSYFPPVGSSFLPR